MLKLPHIAFALLILFILPESSYAVPPPDFLFNIGSQVVQIFSFAVIFLSAAFSMIYKFFFYQKKWLYWGIGIAIIALISIGGAYFYSDYKQNQEYEQWLSESQKYAELDTKQTTVPEEVVEEFQLDKLQKIKRPTTKTDTTVTSKIPTTKTDIIKVPTEDEVTIVKDPTITFIENYYHLIATGQLEEAYAISKKSASLATFSSWYKDTTDVVIDNITQINDDVSSLELTLYEGNKYTRYGVLLTIRKENGLPAQIAASSSKVLSSGTLGEKGDTPVENRTMPSTLSISNEDFKNKIQSSANDYIVLDARENLEYENGHLPESEHIRFADIQAGQWIEIPNDKKVFVLCWSGIRGREVTEFLRSKDIEAYYLINGANGWVEWGGTWIGNIKFAEKYTEEKYKKIFSTATIKEKQAQGVILVDAREPWKYQSKHVPGSVNIPTMYTPSIKFEEVMAQVPPRSQVITICDDYVNCFDAKITGVELENRGHTFLGRYNKPWEYGE